VLFDAILKCVFYLFVSLSKSKTIYYYRFLRLKLRFYLKYYLKTVKFFKIILSNLISGVKFLINKALTKISNMKWFKKKFFQGSLFYIYYI
jgi:hypothetical protein